MTAPTVDRRDIMAQTAEMEPPRAIYTDEAAAVRELLEDEADGHELAEALGLVAYMGADTHRNNGRRGGRPALRVPHIEDRPQGVAP